MFQEDLAESISLLIHCFKRTETSLLFLDGFLHTMGREWFEIDRLRLDKFMMVIKFLNNSLNNTVSLFGIHVVNVILYEPVNLASKVQMV